MPRRARCARVFAVALNGEGLDPELTRAEMDATLPLLAKDPKERYGEMSSDEWDLFASWMAENGLISQAPESGDVVTNDLLPGAPDKD